MIRLVPGTAWHGSAAVQGDAGCLVECPLQLVVVLPSLAQLAIILALQRHEACTLGVVPRPHCRPPGTFVKLGV